MKFYTPFGGNDNVMKRVNLSLFPGGILWFLWGFSLSLFASAILLNTMKSQKFMWNVPVSDYRCEIVQLVDHPSRNRKISDSIPGSDKIFAYWFI